MCADPFHRGFAGAYGVHHAHVSSLLRSARPDLDDRVMADALLDPLSSTLVTHELEAGHHGFDSLEAVLAALVDGLEACAPR
ncbi:hypothetical protein [Nocardiopsis salina]|uniref:hypothetical protein n=1 Tax=Nocardiopsis salina TaxID=245836 RepID=UPI000346C647|nr:hypothetical protein [Nocardiopsis salina]